ncbi:MAG: hypothetical protein V3W18_14130 [candidate division Zixibacteria bacterium]
MMNFPDRISRSERKRFKNVKKTRIALALALALSLLVVGKTYLTDIERLLSRSLARISENGEFTLLADSIIVKTSADFQLSDSLSVDSVITTIDGLSYRRFRQAWPRKIPFEFYIRRLQKFCREQGLLCDCNDSGTIANCSIRLDNRVGAELILEQSRKTRLENRQISVLVKNPGALKNTELLELIETGLPFAYIGSANTYPAGKIKKALASANITAILELPGRKSDIIEPGGKKGKSSNKSRNNLSVLATDILGRHPNTKVLYFDKSNGYDPPFVEEIIRKSVDKGIAYLYDSIEPDFIDSLAYSYGLNIISMKNIAEFNIGRSDEFRVKLTYEMTSPGFSHQRLLVADMEKIKIESLIKLKSFAHKVDINFLDYIGLADTVLSFQRID